MDDQGLQDSAILLMSLGEAEAAAVFKHLTPKEVQRLGETIARMRSVSKERADACWCTTPTAMCVRCSSAPWVTTRPRC